MNNQIISLLNEQLNIQVSHLPIVQNCGGLSIKSDYLRNEILGDMTGCVGTHVLKLSLPIEEYARYKNNTISSIIRENGSIKQHVGHQDIKMADIVDRIFYKVNQHYTETVLAEFQGFFNHIYMLVQNTQTNIIDTINYNFEREYLNELSSITDFFHEVYEDIGDISASRDRCNSYLTLVIGNRQKVLKLIKHFIDKLRGWPATILQRDIVNNKYIDINYSALANDYLVCRQAVSNYAVCLVFEYILSGNIDDKSKDKIITKIERVLNLVKDVDLSIKRALEQRDADNWQNYQWYSHYGNTFRENDRNAINWFIQQNSQNDNFEVQEIIRLFSKSKNLLEHITIE
ncbi:hypothetical protein [Vibrio parahaemolyticus]|uniref:hypothetical protein n=1 Tax=Vibrio parahaemolyticus TaxID=670 RepID=UPI00111ED874|nr:hypothetical protein [Vibrio parahaemolyticus]TOL90921.1 hypothetical protein CGH88_19275 [Vibrio parahaemolyticus]